MVIVIPASYAASADLAIFSDNELPGFGIRVYRTGRKVYIVQTRGPAGSKRAIVGVHGEIRPERARRQATDMIDRIKRGEDPAPPKPEAEATVADLAERYMEAHVKVNCRPGTVEGFGRIVRLYIVPELGALPVSEVGRSHVAALHHKMRDKPYQANQTRDVLAKMFRLAEAWGMTAPRRNPALSIRRYKEHRRERFLTVEEYVRLGAVLAEADTDGSFLPSAVAAMRLLLVTGCRKNEIVTLRWDDIDRTAREIRIRDSKTGARRVPLTPAIEWVLAGIARIEGNPWVIAGRNEHDHGLIASISKSMAVMCVRNTVLEDIHPGIEPVSSTGNFTDVMMIDGNGRETSGPEVSRIGDEEMGRLMRQVVNGLYTFAVKAHDLQPVAMMDRVLAETWRWDEPEIDEIMLSAIASSDRQAKEAK